MDFLKKIIHILSNISYLLIGIYAIVCIPVLFGYHPVVVLSGSMEPTYKVGSVLYYKEVLEKDLKKGDVISFSLEKNQLVSHRIVSIEEGLIETKGDANSVSDVHKISYKNVRGKVEKVSIPYVGYYIKMVNDHLLIVVIAAVVILVSEFLLSNVGIFDINNSDREEEII